MTEEEIKKQLRNQTKKEYDRKYRRNNREKIRRTNMRYRFENKDSVKESQKRWRVKYKRKLVEYSEEKKEELREKRRSYNKNKRKKFAEYKVKLGCKFCGYSKCSSALDFHHMSKESKIVDVSRLYNSKWDIFIYEAKKCIVICRNCHAELHYKEKKNIT